MKKGKRIFIVVACVLFAVVLMYSVCFATDYYTTMHLKEPVFARFEGFDIPEDCAVFDGPGYIIRVEYDKDNETVIYTNMLVLDKTVAAAIV